MDKKTALSAFQTCFGSRKFIGTMVERHITSNKFDCVLPQVEVQLLVALNMTNSNRDMRTGAWSSTVSCTSFVTNRMTNEEMTGVWESITVRIADDGNRGVTRVVNKKSPPLV